MNWMSVVMFLVGVLGVLATDLKINVQGVLDIIIPILIYLPFIFCMAFPVYLEYLLRR